MNKNAIVSFANHKNRYVQNLARLSESLRYNADGIDFLGYINENAIGAPPHSQHPYGFKVHCFKKAFEAGYENILYVDSSVFAIKPVHDLFEHIEKEGMLYQLAGHMVGTWSSDNQLDYFEITRDEAMLMPMIGNAGMLGLNVNNSNGIQFLAEWKIALENNMFQGEWTNNNNTESQDERCLGSRHDMTCSSIIINQMGLIEDAVTGDKILQYGGVFSETINDSIILKAEG